MAVVKEPEVLAPEADDSHEVVGRGRLVWRRFRRRKLAIAGLVVVIGMFVLAFAGPHLTHWDYLDQDLENGLRGPYVDHFFGTTQLGQDVFVRTMKGLQKSLVIGLLTAFFSTGTAAVVGASAGYFGGWVDRI
ncbi:MAG: ABC transporter permease, partial [Acidimicrobiia bacterium]